MPQVNPTKTRKTKNRLAYVRVRRPGALGKVNVSNGVNRREFRKVKRYSARVRRAEKRKATSRKQPVYNPLAPLTGKEFGRERRAAQRDQFGGRTDELHNAIRSQDQATANTGGYYDEYKQAVIDATARINKANEDNAKAIEGRTDAAYQQDRAGVAERDAAQSGTLAKLGAAPVQSSEARQAVSATRAAGNSAAASARTQASADTKYMESRGATATLAKVEALAREHSRRNKLREESKKLAQEKGDFKYKFRNDTREQERTYALAGKEFGLKREDMLLRNKATKADRSLERQKLAAQKIVANIYAGADRETARAQVRVAKLQLKKGKISQRQYREIVNIYRGLPKKGQPGGATPGKPKPLTATEEKTVKDAFSKLTKAGVRVDQKQAAINQLIGKYGFPPRVAREAWNRYKRKAPGSNYGGPH